MSNRLAEFRVRIPPKMKPIFKPARYKVFKGGRGSSKSHSVARYLIIRAYKEKLRILCTREFQNSIQDSVHKLLEDLILEMGFGAYFTINKANITSHNGSEFIFSGLAHNVHSIKSTEGVDICWVEEAERVSQHSWDVLLPTIRKPNSEIIITFNPQFEDDPTYKEFVINPKPDSIVIDVNWSDNPWFPDVLKREMDHCKASDYEKYLHIWEGHTRTISDAQIFKGRYAVVDFISEAEDVHRFGADWGFGVDPVALTDCFVRGTELFIEHEAVGYGTELYDIPPLWRGSVPNIGRNKIWGDNSRPETISYLCKPKIIAPNGIEHQGFYVVPAPKWPGSVEDGIEFMRGNFSRINIHPRCKNTIYEMTAYRYKVDKLTEEVLPIIIDKHNHCIDAIRYSLSPLITQNVTIFDGGVVD